MPEKEESIVKRLTERFAYISATIQRERRIWIETPREKILELMPYLHNELGFTSLCAVTGLDLGEEYQLIYHLTSTDGVVLNVKENAPHSDPVFDTVTDLYKGGILSELEARNLLGLTIRGIPDDILYPLPDQWPEGEYPLRKTWTSLNDQKENT